MNHYKLFEKRSVQRFARFARRVISERSLESFRYLLPGHLRLEHIDLVITTKCTLRCKNCSHMINLYQSQQDVNSEAVIKTIKKLQEFVDRIDDMQLIGGEPFCNPNLKYFIKAISLEKCKKVSVLSNGTILPNDPELFSLFKEKQITVVFSNYGALSHMQAEFIKELEAHHIPFIIGSSNSQWYDLGKGEVYQRSQRELNRQFSKCSSSQCISTLNGMVYICARSTHGNNLGIIKVPDDECVDLFRLDKKQFIRQMKKLLHRDRALTACKYCNYMTDNCMCVPKAEQMEKT